MRNGTWTAIGYEPTASNNSVLVTGAGSVWTNSSSLLVGSGGGSSNTLQVSNGGVVHAGGLLSVASNNTVTTDGAVLVGNGGSPQSINVQNTDSSLDSVLALDGTLTATNVTVAGGGFIFGSGTLDSDLTIASGGTLSPGNSPGTMNIAGNIDWLSGGNYNWQILDAAGAAGTAWDLTSATGVLDLSALTSGNQYNINLWSLSSIGPDVSGNANNFDNTQNYSWTILTAAGGITNYTGSSQFAINSGATNGTGGFSDLNGGTFSVQKSGNNLNLVFLTGGPDFNVTSSLDVTSGTNSYLATQVGGFYGSGVTLGVLNGGTLLSNTYWLTVGFAGGGNSLVISNGGEVRNGTWTAIGFEPTASNNSVLVTGSGSILQTLDRLLVGEGGSGNSLTIADGGNVESATGYIGSLGGFPPESSSNNSVLVTGAGSVWTNSSSLYVGQYGSGNSLVISDGGTVAASDVIIGYNVGSSGTLNIGRFGTNDTAGTIIAPTIAFGDGTGAINFNQRDATTLAANISGNGIVNQLGTGTTTLSGSNTYTGATTVAAGRLVVDGSIAASAVTVQSGGALSGSGAVGAISGAGSIDPGNSPGIFTATSLDPSGGLSFNFEFTSLNPTYSNASASVNDVLRLTDATPFVASLTGVNTVNVYFNVDLFKEGQTYTGGFFTDPQLDFLAEIVDGSFNYYVKDAAGSVNYGGETYSALGAGLAIELTTASQSGDFAGGTVDGQISQFEVVPEPSTYALLAISAAGLVGFVLRHRRP